MAGSHQATRLLQNQTHPNDFKSPRLHGRGLPKLLPSFVTCLSSQRRGRATPLVTCNNQPINGCLFWSWYPVFPVENREAKRKTTTLGGGVPSRKRKTPTVPLKSKRKEENHSWPRFLHGRLFQTPHPTAPLLQGTQGVPGSLHHRRFQVDLPTRRLNRGAKRGMRCGSK